MELPKIKSVTATAKYKLFIRFADLTEGEYDVSHLAKKGVFKNWDTEDTFFQVCITPNQVPLHGRET